MTRRTFLRAAAGLAAACAGASVLRPARAGRPGIVTRLAGRPGGGLPITILPPAGGAAPHPALIFSPGYGGRPAGFVRLVAPWVAAGFVLLLPEHLDLSAATRRTAPPSPISSATPRCASRTSMRS